MATECQIGFATLKTQFINQFINHQRFLAILCLVLLEDECSSEAMCVALNIHLQRKVQKQRLFIYSLMNWSFKFIQQDVKLSRSVSSFAGRKLLCSHLSILDIHNSWIFETDARLGLVWTLLIRWWKWSWVPEFWNLRITSTTTPAVFFFDSDSSQMLFNPYTCWGINTGTRLYHVRSG